MEKLIHEMENLGFGLDDSATCNQKQISSVESGLLTIQRQIKQFVHAYHCNANCRLPTCQRMKRIIEHAKSCGKDVKLKTKCSICKLFLDLCCHHSIYCKEARCHVPYCSKFKTVMKKHGLQQAQILKMVTASLKKRIMSAGPGNSNQLSPGAQPHSSPHPPQPGIGMKPSTGPPVGALQAVQVQAAAAAARQTAPHMVAASVNYGKGNPVPSPPIPNMGLMAATQQMQKPVSRMISGEPNCMLNMGCWEGSGYAQNLQPHQNLQTPPNPQLGLRQPTQQAG